MTTVKSLQIILLKLGSNANPAEGNHEKTMLHDYIFRSSHGEEEQLETTNQSTNRKAFHHPNCGL